MLSVVVNANDVAVCGAGHVVSAVVLVPPGTVESDVRDVFAALPRALPRWGLARRRSYRGDTRCESPGRDRSDARTRRAGTHRDPAALARATSCSGAPSADRRGRRARGRSADRLGKVDVASWPRHRRLYSTPASRWSTRRCRLRARGEGAARPDRRRSQAVFTRWPRRPRGIRIDCSSVLWFEPVSPSARHSAPIHGRRLHPECCLRRSLGEGASALSAFAEAGHVQCVGVVEAGTVR